MSTHVRVPLAEEVSWQLRGHCRTATVDFYPETPQLERKSRPAQRVCSSCPVIYECRKWALTHHEEWGVWGGLSELDREAIWTGHRRYHQYSA